MYRAALLVMLLVVQAEAIAAPANWLDYESLDPSQRSLLEFRLDAAGDAFGWANAQLGTKGQPALYCSPQSLALNSKNYLEIYRAELDRNPTMYQDLVDETDPSGSGYIGLVLLKGLMAAFPCSR